MKKLLGWTAALGAAACLILWGGSSLIADNYAGREWPLGLGTLDSVPARFPASQQNEPATKLVALASAAQIDVAPVVTRRRAARSSNVAARLAIADYTKKELARPGAIDAPPPAVVNLLAATATTMDAVRDHLLSSQPVVWPVDVTKGFDGPMPNLLGHMHIQRLLIARALDKARVGDPAAWEELHASWQLNRGLWGRPDLMSNLIAVASTRMANDAARKMPRPAPAWLAEMRTFDYVRPMAAAHQAEAYAYEHGARAGSRSVRSFLAAPLLRLQALAGAETMRLYVTAAVSADTCDTESAKFAVARAIIMTPPRSWLPIRMFAMPNILGAWDRMLKMRCEIAATQRAVARTSAPAFLSSRTE